MKYQLSLGTLYYQCLKVILDRQGGVWEFLRHRCQVGFPSFHVGFGQRPNNICTAIVSFIKYI